MLCRKKRKKSQEPLLRTPNLCWTLRCRNRYRYHVSPSGPDTVTSQQRQDLTSTFYEFLVSHRRFLLQGSSSHVPKRPSVFASHSLLTQSSQSQPSIYAATSAIHAPSTMPQPPQRQNHAISGLRPPAPRSSNPGIGISCVCSNALFFSLFTRVLVPCYYICLLKSEQTPQRALGLSANSPPPPPTVISIPTLSSSSSTHNSSSLSSRSSFPFFFFFPPLPAPLPDWERRAERKADRTKKAKLSRLAASGVGLINQS
ncbi:hypothetical protein LI328DRAFT_31236 [Trichoderma asperelloides]|nr:hypothetical protein LI328DRAFT_31236 [Trichoderma asperelloides]